MNPPADFVAVTTPTRLSDGEFAIDLPDGWQQGRGAFGGLVVASLWRAARACEPEAERTLRSLSAEIMGPVQPGPTRLRVEVLRRGSAVSTLDARLLQGSEMLAHALVVLGRSRPQTPRWNRLAPPTPTPFAAVPEQPGGIQFGAPFAKFFEYYPLGPQPFDGNPQAQPVVTGWVRLRHPAAQLGAAEILGLADAYWPGALVLETAPRPMATLTFTFELLCDPAQLPPAAPVFHRGEAIVAHDGYTVELRELWSESGELLALNQQTIAIIK